jgi:hypothetical protein
LFYHILPLDVGTLARPMNDPQPVVSFVADVCNSHCQSLDPSPEIASHSTLSPHFNFDQE